MWLSSLFDELKKDTNTIWKRFPVASLLLVAISVMASFLIISEEKNLMRLIMAGIIAILVSMVSYIKKETNWINQGMIYFGQVMAVGIGILYFILLPDKVDQLHEWHWIVFISCVGILLLSISVLPFIRSYDGYLQYNNSLFIATLMATFIAAILFSASSLFVLALQNLFDLAPSYKIYAHFGIWSFLFIGLGRLMSDFPPIPYDKNSFVYHRGTSFVVTYIGIPITIAYGLLVYAYVFKSIFSGGKTVLWFNPFFLWFTSIGFVVYLLNKAIHPKRWLNEWFSKVWLMALLPLSVFYLFNLWKNINTDGLDRPYYYLGLGGLAMVGTLLSMLFFKKNDLRIINILGIALLAIGILPHPYNGRHWINRTMQRDLLSYFTDHGLIRNDTLVASDTTLALPPHIHQKIKSLLRSDQTDFVLKYDHNHLLDTPITDYGLLQNLNITARYGEVADNERFDHYHKRQSFDISTYKTLYPILETSTLDNIDDGLYLYQSQLYLVNNSQSSQIKISLNDVHKSSLSYTLADSINILLIINNISGDKVNGQANINFIEGYGLIK